MTMTFKTVRSDTLPENTRYADDGCDVSASCLECPLSMCKYDDPGWLRREDRKRRDDEIFRLRKMGVPVPELARQFKVSSRTVHRIVQRGGSASDSDDDEGPALSLDELADRTVIRRRAPLPDLRSFLRQSA
jgi:hypothetical protein